MDIITGMWSGIWEGKLQNKIVVFVFIYISIVLLYYNFKAKEKQIRGFVKKNWKILVYWAVVCALFTPHVSVFINGSDSDTGECESQEYSIEDAEESTSIMNTTVPVVSDAVVDKWSAILELETGKAVTGRLKDKNDINNYHVNISENSAVKLSWKAGDNNTSEVGFGVSIYAAKDMSRPITYYELQVATKIQVSYPLFLPRGDYIISVESINYVDTPYSIKIDVVPNAYIEEENNDNASNATPIKVNQIYYGSLVDKEDIDYYTFFLEKPGCVNLAVYANYEERRSERYKLTISDKTDQTLYASLSMMGDTTEGRSPNLYLDEGHYMVRVEKGNYASLDEYQIQVEYGEVSDAELESNNTIESSTKILTNREIVASLGMKGDVDWYSFLLTADSIIQPDLSFKSVETSTFACRLLIKSEDITLLTGNIRGKESRKHISPLVLPAGKYYIAVENLGDSSQEYILHINTENVKNAERENNDALAQATEFEGPAVYTGILINEEDVDLYRIEFREKTKALLNFNFPVDVENGTCIIQIEQNGRSLWSKTVRTDGGGIKQQMDISAGKYYIRIRPSSWVETVYNLEFSY